MATIEKSIEVDCSAHTAYERLSRVESYTQLPDIEEAQRRGDRGAHIVAQVAGQREEFDVEFDRVPDERLAWHTVSNGLHVHSELIIEPRGEQHAMLHARVRYDPQELRDRYHWSQADVDRRMRERLTYGKSYVEGRLG